MAKPILVIRTPQNFAGSSDKIQRAIRKQLQDEYHVLMVSQDTDELSFEVFNVDKEEPIGYGKLKELINKEVEPIEDGSAVR